MSTFRTKTTPVTLDCRGFCGSTNGWVSSPISDIGYGSLSQKTDSVTRDYPINWNYARLIASGLNATTSMSGSRFGYTLVRDVPMYLDPKSKSKIRHYSPISYSGAAYYKDSSGSFKTTKSFKGPWPFAQSLGVGYTDDMSQAQSQAMKYFNKRIIETQRALSGLVSLGELRETLHAIRHPAKAFREGLSDYLSSLKKRFRGVPRSHRKKLRQIVSDTWLEYSFGWKPLCADIDDGIVSLNRYLYRRLPREMIHAHGISYGQSRDPASSSSVAEVTFVNDGIIHAGISQYKLYGVVSVIDTYRQVFPSFGISFLEVVPAVWELIPYSFLVDYFTNIGDILDAFTIRTSNIRWVAFGTRIRRFRWGQNPRFVFPPTLPGSSPLQRWDHGDRVITPDDKLAYFEESISRGTIGVYNPYPDFSLEVPGLSTKWINISALLFSRNKLIRR